MTTTMAIYGANTDLRTLARRSPEDAGKALLALSITARVQETALDIRRESGGALLLSLPPDEAVSMIRLDNVGLHAGFGTTVERAVWDRAESDLVEAHGQADPADVLAALTEERDCRTVEVMVRGEQRSRFVAICVEPAVAVKYLETVLSNEDASWRDRVLEDLGVTFVAYCLLVIDLGMVEVEDERELRDLLSESNHELYHDAVTLADRHNDPLALEDDLIVEHAEATFEHYGIDAEAGRFVEEAAEQASAAKRESLASLAEDLFGTD